MSASGFTLTEVMVSLLLLSMLFIGLDAMQVASIQQTRAAGNLILAEEQWINFSERMRAVSGLRGFSIQVHRFKAQTAIVLPGSRVIVRGTLPLLTVTIDWGNTGTSCTEGIRIGLSGCIRKTGFF